MGHKGDGQSEMMQSDGCDSEELSADDQEKINQQREPQKKKEISWERQKRTEIKTEILNLTRENHARLTCECGREGRNQNDCSHAWNHNYFYPFLHQ